MHANAEYVQRAIDVASNHRAITFSLLQARQISYDTNTLVTLFGALACLKTALRFMGGRLS